MLTTHEISCYYYWTRGMQWHHNDLPQCFYMTRITQINLCPLKEILSIVRAIPGNALRHLVSGGGAVATSIPLQYLGDTWSKLMGRKGICTIVTLENHTMASQPKIEDFHYYGRDLLLCASFWDSFRDLQLESWHSHSSARFRKLLSWLPNVFPESMTRLSTSHRSS